MSTRSQEPSLISADVAAALLRISRRRFFQIVEQGWIAKADRGRYRIRDVVQGFIALRDDQIERAERKNIENRIRDARAREIELRTARNEADLVPTDEVIAYTKLVVDAVMIKLREVPAKFTDSPDERKRLSDIIERIGAKVDDAGADFRRAWGRGR